MLLPLSLLVAAFSVAGAAPAPPEGFTCSSNRSIYPCPAFALFRFSLPLSASGIATTSSPSSTNDLDLAAVADLFSISRLSLSRANNLSSPSLIPSPSSPLLVPLSCSCPLSFSGAANNHSFAAVPYQILSGDTYYLVSTLLFQNLTQYQAVELVNPSLVPTDLDIGTIVTFPIFCQCPIPSSKISYFVSYVTAPSDTYVSLSADFDTSVAELTVVNGPESSVPAYSNILIPITNPLPPVIRRTAALAHLAPLKNTTNSRNETENDNRKGAVIGLSVALVVVTVALLAAVFAAMRRGMKAGSRGAGGEGIVEESGEKVPMMTGISEWLDKYRVYEVEELRKATKGFDKGCQIARTGVYVGVVDGGMQVAVKKMKWDAREELKILQKVNHMNLVKLEGFCIDGDTTYLVFEYLPNGSLDMWLHGNEDGGGDREGRSLGWGERVVVARDVALGLEYIHEHTWPRVVHKDVKSANVLLDGKRRGKVANFGLARTGINAVTTHIIGTQGYIAPEYLTDGIVSTKMDVFAYGVLLLELISGKEAIAEDGKLLWMEATERFFDSRDGTKVSRLREWLDPVLADETVSSESLSMVMNLAKACLQRDHMKRPSMVDVAYALSKAIDDFLNYSNDSLPVADGEAHVSDGFVSAQ